MDSEVHLERTFQKGTQLLFIFRLFVWRYNGPNGSWLWLHRQEARIYSMVNSFADKIMNEEMPCFIGKHKVGILAVRQCLIYTSILCCLKMQLS